MNWIGSVLIMAMTAQQPAPAIDMTPAEKEFQQQMTNVIMVGHYTVGAGTELRDDRYVIDSVTKVKDGLWTFRARVQFGAKDVPVSLDVPVFFAGDTPVLSFPRQAVQGLGVYEARVIIYKGGYAGTWGGDAAGGKMFGSIVKQQ